MKKSYPSISRLPRKVFDYLLTLSASSYVIVVFLIKEKTLMPFVPKELDFVFYIVYLVAPVLVAWFCLVISRFLPACGMECEIKEIELASHSFLPNYLGYFFVALSIPDARTFFFVYLVVFVFVHLSQALSFNPLFLLLGYQFYFVTGEDGTKIFLITKQKMKMYQDVRLNNLRRINDFTFIDMR